MQMVSFNRIPFFSETSPLFPVLGQKWTSYPHILSHIHSTDYYRHSSRSTFFYQPNNFRTRWSFQPKPFYDSMILWFYTKSIICSPSSHSMTLFPLTWKYYFVRFLIIVFKCMWCLNNRTKNGDGNLISTVHSFSGQPGLKEQKSKNYKTSFWHSKLL